jgi:hypothetical protein
MDGHQCAHKYTYERIWIHMCLHGYICAHMDTYVHMCRYALWVHAYTMHTAGRWNALHPAQPACVIIIIIIIITIIIIIIIIIILMVARAFCTAQRLGGDEGLDMGGHHEI